MYNSTLVDLDRSWSSDSGGCSGDGGNDFMNSGLLDSEAWSMFDDHPYYSLLILLNDPAIFHYGLCHCATEASPPSARWLVLGVVFLLLLEDVTHRCCSECECHFHTLEEDCCKPGGYKSTRKPQGYIPILRTPTARNPYFEGTFPNFTMPLSDEARHPQTWDLSALIVRDRELTGFFHPHTRIYKGKMEDGATTTVVAIKHILPHGNIEEDWARVDVRTRREIVVWMSLEHENVMELLGTVITDSLPYRSTGMVSRWMVNGNLGAFVTDDLPLAQRLQITCDVAAGLKYLHGKHIMHGDLTSTNVLIDDNGKACLIDFGLSLIKDEFEGTSFFNSKIGGALRFRALEISPPVNGDYENFKPLLTFACDVYSLGSVILQVLSSLQPYYNIRDETSVALALAQKKKPAPPPDSIHLTEEYWEFIQKCWDAPENRPSAAGAHEELLHLRDGVLSTI